MEKGGNMPAILNAANEAAVEAFLQGNLAFSQISEVVEKMMNTMSFINKPSFKDLYHSHNETFNKSKRTNQKNKLKPIMEILIKILQLILSLSVLVIVHEFGHFAAAKYFKTKVGKILSLFQPWLFSFQIQMVKPNMV